MVEYCRHLMQDALETNWGTARHAHLVVLQEIERGKLSWKNPDQVDKVRIRNTARVLMQKPGNHPTTKNQRNRTKDRICADYKHNNCSQTSDHVVEGIINRHACQYCFSQVGRYCAHKTQDCMRRKSREPKDHNN